jgi:hypothetical protein
MSSIFAYLDLATDSMVVQAAIAGLVVVPVLLRSKVRGLLRRGPAVMEPDGDLGPSVHGVSSPSARSGTR